MKELFKTSVTALTLFALLAVVFALSGCGGGGSGGLSSQVVSGTASVGAPLAGEVNLKDASATPQVRTTVIGSDGSYAIDVTGMTAPFILQATGNAAGTNYTLHSFAQGTGTTNINPLSEAIVASAVGGDASDAYDHSDGDKLNRIGSNLQAVVTTILSKLQPLLQQYNAQHTNPITTRYIANHLGLDEMFDQVKITVNNGVLTISYSKTGAVIFTGSVTDIANGVFNPGSITPPVAVPSAPTTVTATGGTGQVKLAWGAVSNATSYNLYFATSAGVTIANGTKIPVATNSYLQTGLPAATTYYYIVTAVNSAGESAGSVQVLATTAAAAPAPTAPGAPSGVSATGGTRQVTVSWPAVTGATSYNLYYSTTSGVTIANGTKIAGATSPAVQMGLADATTYYYVVTAVNTVGESAASVQVAATTLPAAPSPTAPAAPTGVSAKGGAASATISWTAVSGATSYNVYWSTTSGVTAANGTRIPGATSPYVQTGLSAGTTYYYVVTALNSVGESVASAQASAVTNAPPPAVPAAPTGVSATGGANQVSISWTAVSGATSYNLYWSKTAGVTTATGTKISAVTSPFVQTGLTAGTTYYYLVTAVNASGESPSSTQATAATNPPVVVVPAAPTGVSATGGTKQVSVSWSAVSGATSYNVYYSTATGVTTGNGTKISGATAPFVRTGLLDGTAYYFIVTAVNSSGESAASAQVSATTAAAVPAFDALSYYNSVCLGCHGSLGVRSAAQITSAIAGVGSMKSLSTLTAAQIAAIAAVSY